MLFFSIDMYTFMLIAFLLKFLSSNLYKTCIDLFFFFPLVTGAGGEKSVFRRTYHSNSCV